MLRGWKLSRSVRPMRGSSGMLVLSFVSLMPSGLLGLNLVLVTGRLENSLIRTAKKLPVSLPTDPLVSLELPRTTALSDFA